MVYRKPFYIARSYLLALLDFFAAEYDAEYLIAGFGELQEKLSGAGEYITDGTLDAVLNTIAPHVAKSTFALRFGQSLTLEEHGFLGYAAKSSPDVRTAMFMDIQYLQTRMSIVKFNYTEYEQLAELQFQFLGSAGGHKVFLSQCLLSSLSAMLVQMTGFVLSGDLYVEHNESLPPEVLLPFFDVTMHYNAAQTKLTFDKRFLDVQVSSSDENLYDLAQNQCHEIASQFSLDTLFSDRVASILDRQLTMSLTQHDIANEMHVSVRTLKRLLSQEGAKYQTILQAVRERRAKKLLTDHQATLEDIAQQLGYCDASAFIKAFRRWTKCTPAEYRRRYGYTS